MANIMVSMQNILKEFGYKEPIAYYICLDASHQNLWSTKDSSTDLCQYCQKPGTIEFHYLTLSDKVKRWYSNSEGDSSLVAKRKMVA